MRRRITKFYESFYPTFATNNPHVQVTRVIVTYIFHHHFLPVSYAKLGTAAGLLSSNHRHDIKKFLQWIETSRNIAVTGSSSF
jgi:hypothetical protein